MMRFNYFAGGLAAGALLVSSCSTVNQDERVYQMGELATVGPVIYNVLETEWRTGLGDALDQSIPKNRYLLVRLTVTNSGNNDVAIPLLSLVDANEKTYLETSDVKDVPGWLGLLRVVQPASTLQGTIVFDVPVSDYHLRVTDGGDLENERTALVQIPLSLGAPDPIQSPDTVLE